jgi:hypothetical protein
MTIAVTLQTPTEGEIVRFKTFNVHDTPDLIEVCIPHEFKNPRSIGDH